jgi:quercetin dioxygenase-like cupin family protein
MAVSFNESTVAAEPAAPGVHRQRLLTSGRVPDTRVLLDRMTLAAGTRLELNIPAQDVAWFQVLEGEAVLRHTAGAEALGHAHIVFLPPEFSGTLEATKRATVLYALVPDAGRFDVDFAAARLNVVDWTREPVLDSQHDARKRIYVATPRLFGTRAIKGEMIIYPPGTEGANHHHEGAQHFMYVLRGRGTAHANERPIGVREGDLIYYEDGERHYLRSEGDEDMVFVEFFVPGTYKTIWADGAPICTWLPTGHDIRGGEPVRAIKSHNSAMPTPQDV